MSIAPNRTRLTIEVPDEDAMLRTVYRLEVSVELNLGCREGGSEYHGWTPGEAPFVESVHVLGAPWLAIGGVPFHVSGIWEAKLQMALDAKYKAGGWFKDAVEAACLERVGV